MLTVSNGAYQRTRIVVDYINIIACVAVLITAAAIFFMPWAMKDKLIPIVFFLGALVNGCHAIKWHFKFRPKRMWYHVLLTLILLGIMTFSAIALW